MTAIGEGLELSKAALSLPAQYPTSGVLSAPAAFIPRTPRECRDIAEHLAQSIVTGFVEHDKGHIDKAVSSFFQVYLHLFPHLSPLKIQRAAELYVQTCVKQDEIEDHLGHTRAQIVEDPRWDDVKSIFLEQTKTLGLPDEYAEHTTNYFRYHGVRDDRYISHCLEADRIFTTAIIGDDYWAKILGGLYLICTECHDKHDLNGLQAGVEFATKYFELILKAKISRQGRALATLQA